MEESITLKDICEDIEKAEILFYRPNGYQPSALEIFEYSPSGELYMVFEWYEKLKLIRSIL